MEFFSNPVARLIAKTTLKPDSNPFTFLSKFKIMLSPIIKNQLCYIFPYSMKHVLCLIEEADLVQMLERKCVSKIDIYTRKKAV